MSTPLSGRIRGATFTLLAMALLGTARHAAAAASAWDGLPASPVWGNVQYGMNYLQRRSDAMKAVDGSNAYWKLEGGMRLAKEWLAGIGFQEIAVSSDRCTLAEIQFFNCEDKSEKLTQWYATVVFNPRRGMWLYQAGVGRAKYSNTFDTTTFEREQHKGLALHLGAGFDWTPQTIDDVHIGMRATWEYAKLGQHSGGLGSYAHSRLSVGFSLSFY